jgi:diguanylate cyclase (GGDEF)-like protein
MFEGGDAAVTRPGALLRKIFSYPRFERRRANRGTSLAAVLGADASSDPLTRQVRAAQIAGLARLLPLSNLVNLINGSLLAAALSSRVPIADLIVWLAGIASVVAVRIYAAASARRRPMRAAFVHFLVAVSALLWTVPPLLWFDAGSADDRLLILCTVAGMMCGGSVALATIPLASWIYVSILGSAMVVAEVAIGHHSLAVMTVGFMIVLGCTSLWHGRQFVDHQRLRMELKEQSELVQLMREFQANGSGWLWELDSKLRLTYLTSDREHWSSRRINRLLGKHVRDILDPTGRFAQVSEGVREVFDHFDECRQFRDMAVPTAEGRWWSLSGKPVFDSADRCTGWRGLGSDITQARMSGIDAVGSARHDPLTGLANRLMIREQLEEAMIHGSDGGCVLMLVDLDRFKLVNDTLGHAVGDELLRHAAKRMQKACINGSLVGRLGGDEFAILLAHVLPRTALVALADRVIAAVSAPYQLAGSDVRIGASIGIAVAPTDGQAHEELMMSADLALYRAKEDGRGVHRFFERWMGDVAKTNRRLEADLRVALQDGGLSLAYQPIVSAKGGATLGYEALLRWNHPTEGDIPPDRFVPIIEDAGLINDIAGWVIRQACAEAATWPRPCRIAVNVSPVQLTASQLAETVASALAISGLLPDRLEIEVSERIFMGDDDATLESLGRLRELGVRLVIDDFGTGHSSFGYFHRAHFSKIKIDKLFVHGAAAGQREHLAIIEAILALARRLDIETTAEGIETQRQEQVMRQLGCGQLQGFRFGRPAVIDPARTARPRAA